MKCKNTFTNWILAINIILLCIPNIPKSIKIAFINLLIWLLIAGNILVSTHGKTIRKLCNNFNDSMSSNSMSLGTILFHICLPILFILIWLRKKTATNFIPAITTFIAISISLIIGIIYFILMNLKVTFNYGLDTNTTYIYVCAFILLTIMFNILSFGDE